MTAGYARLCLQYVGAVCLRRGTVGLGDFTAAALADPDTLALARRLTVIEDGNPDPNALIPQRVEIDLAEAAPSPATVAAVLGSPERPLSPEAATRQIRRLLATRCPICPPEQGGALWQAVVRARNPRRRAQPRPSGRSVDALQRRGLALLDGSTRGTGVARTEELVRQALIADRRVRVGRLGAAGP